jgi:hypothetical protein
MERDRTDPTCPHCGEGVGARATYCMHCGRDIPDRASDRQSETVDDGEALLTRVRSAASGATADESAAEGFDPRADDVTWDDDRARGDDRSPTADRDRDRSTGRESADSRRLRMVSGVDLSGRAAGRFLAAVALGWVALAVGLGLSVAAAGGWTAVLSSAAVVAVVSRARTPFDGLRFGGIVVTLAMVFVPFGMAAAIESGAGFSPIAVAFVSAPVVVSTAVVALLGHE